jgi:hypothetical protein
MKSYPSTTKDEFYRDKFIAVDLVEIYLINETLRLTTGGFDISHGGNTYAAQGDFIGFSTVSEDFDVKVGKFTIYLSALNNDYLTKFLGNNIQGSRVVVYKAFLDLTTLGIVVAPIMMFDGIIYNIACTESARSAQITLDCSSLFADFERAAGRKTNNWSNWVFQGVNYDTSMEKSGFVGQTEFKWGRN